MPLYSRKIMSKISCEDGTNINTELGKYSLFKVVAFFIKFEIGRAECRERVSSPV